MNKFILSGLAAALLSGCSSTSVKLDYDPGTDFSTLKTYAWQHAKQPETGDPRIDNDLMDDRVRRAVDQTLAAKGYRPTDPEGADFRVAYFVEYQRKLNSSSVSVGVGRGSYGRYGGMGYSTGISEYDEANLIIDIIDPADEKTIWRGVGSRTAYSGSSPKKMTKIANESVAGILKKFPPGK